MTKNITVIGSSNTDMVVKTSAFPKPGETVIGGEFLMHAGGKGANQAVAAARFGGIVSFVTKIGKDLFGSNAVNSLKHNNVDIKYILQDDKRASGVALITVNENGENQIVVAPGANGVLTISDIDSSSSVFEHGEIVLIQLEIPLPTVYHSIKKAHEYGCKVILNPAPAAEMASDIYSKIYLITPNETEASILTGISIREANFPEKVSDVLLSKGVKNVIITLGAKGAYFKNKKRSMLVPAIKVNPVDTTAAGDIFNGVIAVALAEGNNWEKAIGIANKASAIGVSRMGAQSSAPYRNEVLVK